MSSTQATLDGFQTDSPDEPETAPESEPEPEFDVPNFNRERGEERTELGAGLGELCEGAREYEPRRTRHSPLNIEGGADAPGDGR